MKKAKIHLRQNASPEDGPDISERIIASAMKLFGRTSHYYVSLREISMDADVTLSLTIYYFQNKENLYRIAFERTMTPLDDYFRRVGRHLDHNPRLSKRDVTELFLDCIGTTFDVIYGHKDNRDSCGKMILYELTYPTSYHEEFHEKYFMPHFESIARLMMRINHAIPYQSAFQRGITILGEILSFMVQRELVAKTLEITEIGPKERNRFREMLINHSLNMIHNVK